MSESPIQLRGKSGGVVFDGTQSPGGGSQTVRKVTIGFADVQADPFGTGQAGCKMLDVPANTEVAVAQVIVTEAFDDSGAPSYSYLDPTGLQAPINGVGSLTAAQTQATPPWWGTSDVLAANTLGEAAFPTVDSSLWVAIGPWNGDGSHGSVDFYVWVAGIV